MTFLNFFILAIWCHYSYISLKWKGMDIRWVSTFGNTKKRIDKNVSYFKKRTFTWEFSVLFSTSETRNCENAKNGNLETKLFFHFMRDFDAVLNLRVYLTIAFRISSDKTYYMVLSDASLREKCPNTEFFLVRIFLYLDWIRTITE